ncbi:hypothetical protein SAMN04488109_2059 [Chryseolinea serpens]|uniref:Uncharacterized protein n=1 Tax=Chryseolinea serpens TaxID=947013 RepID=A0A1M5N2X2_9BACT|nr:hypothetical protein [Chryseolinea serpens]SHG83519.1 hypothetical protein SAMN04488109_2059 [Chryseolinea serpens]
MILTGFCAFSGHRITKRFNIQTGSKALEMNQSPLTTKNIETYVYDLDVETHFPIIAKALRISQARLFDEMTTAGY